MAFLSQEGTDSHHLDFSPPLLRLQETPPHPLGRRVLWCLLLLVFVLVIWALWGRLDIVAVAEGKLVPQSYVKIVQPAESGIVRDILVGEGDRVAAGQVLLRMDAVISEAEVNALKSELERKRLSIQRIDAELSGIPFQADEASDMSQEIAAQYAANRAAFAAALAEESAHLTKARQDLFAAEQVRNKLSQTLPHYREQEKAYGQLVEKGYAGPLMLSDKRRERIEKEQELKTQDHVIASARASILQSEKTIAQIESDYRRQLYAERNETANAVEQLTQELAKQAHRKALLELKAPQDGVVKDLATHTIGTVVQPGTVLLTLVPEQEALRAEVWVTNADIGFVYPGQSVKLKFAAFPFQKYGLVEGTVEHVSADAADGTSGGANTSNPDTGRPTSLVYKTRVRLKSEALELNGHRFRLAPGMQTNAEILLGTRTVAEYLLSPVQQAWHESARER